MAVDPAAGSPPEEQESEDNDPDGHHQDREGGEGSIVRRGLALIDERPPLGSGGGVGGRRLRAGPDGDRVEKRDDGGFGSLPGATGATGRRGREGDEQAGDGEGGAEEAQEHQHQAGAGAGPGTVHR
jgi:hypothetical protein